MRKLYFHIGAPKCGSTSIQSFLAAKWTELREQGFAVIGSDCTLFQGEETNRPGPIDKYEAYIRQALGSSDPVDPEQAVYWLRDEIMQAAEATACDKFVLSAENFCHIGGMGQKGRHARTALLRPVTEAFETHLIIYIRRQDVWAEAAWKQWWIQSADADYWQTILHHAVLGVPSFFVELENLASLFGRECMHVRVLDRKLLTDGSLISDFLSLLNTDFGPIDEEIHNKTPPRSVISFLSARHNPQSKQFDDALFSLLDELGDTEGERLLVEEQRWKLLKLFKNENEQLVKNYFPGQEATLRNYFWLDKTGLSGPDPATDPAAPSNAEVMSQQLAKFDTRLRDLEGTVSAVIRALSKVR